METCPSPRTALRVAYRLGRQFLPDRSRRFSRQDFTLPQLFACLVAREMLRLPDRRAEAFPRDARDRLADIGPARAPDHNTLWRAFGALCTARRLNRVPDLQADLFRKARRLRLRRQPLTADSTCYEPHQRSRPNERRFGRGADGRLYGQRAQAETIHRMLKRDLGEHLRSRLPQRRRAEMLFRAAVHHTTLIGTLDTG